MNSFDAKYYRLILEVAVGVIWLGNFSLTTGMHWSESSFVFNMGRFVDLASKQENNQPRPTTTYLFPLTSGSPSPARAQLAVFSKVFSALTTGLT